MADPAWLEVRAVVRCDSDLVATVRSWLDDSDLVEVNRIDVTQLDEDLRRWDGGRPPGVVVDRPLATGGLVDSSCLPRIGERSCTLGMPEPLGPVLDRLPTAPTAHPVFDQLRRGHVIEPLPELFDPE